MINIYIKSFARPFYLDRCIRSVKFNLNGYDRIIVLDDGTEQKHLAKIGEIHPDVEIRSSGADDGKLDLLRQEKFDDIARLYPVASEFWAREVGKDPYSHTVILEDDSWIVRHIDLPSAVNNLEKHEAVICKLWWSSHVHHVSTRYQAERGPLLEYITTGERLREAASAIWIVAFAIFRRDYWLHCVSQAKRLGDERSQLAAALEFAANRPEAAFAKTERRCVHQGWVIPARSTPEYYDKGLVQHRYMDALNGEWFDGRLSAIEGYPYDFSKEYIMRQLANSLPDSAVKVWSDWHRDDTNYFFD